MKTYAEYEERGPSYALPYIVNGDASGLENDEIIRIDAWADQSHEIAQAVNGHVIFSPRDEEPHFTHRPAFGLACDCIKCDILILVSNDAKIVE